MSSTGCSNGYSPKLVQLLLLVLVVASSHGFFAVADLNADTQALLAFLKGVAVARRVSWSTNTSTCTWVGVECSPAPNRVTSLRLPAVGLYGQIPSGTLGLLSELRVLSLRSNKLQGPLPPDLANCIQLRSLYLQNNKLSGPLLNFTTTPRLNRINLSSNNFSGSIPSSFARLSRLGTLYLQNNSLTGVIPPLNLSSLAQFSVAFNHLNGSIPVSLLQKFPPSAFAGNNFCGALSFPPCPTNGSSPSPSPSASAQNAAAGGKAKRLSTGNIVAIAVAAGALLFLIIVCLVVACMKKRSPRPAAEKATKTERAIEKGDDSKDEYSSAQEPERNKLVFFEGSQYSFDLEDLLRASAEVLGKGSVGTAYKAVLEDGSTVVVKRLKDVAVGRKDFEQQMELIGKLQNRHLVPLRAYYYSKDEKLLVHDYLAMGSLSALLHGSKGSGRTPLDWDTRVRISLGAARGIAFLHEQGGSNKFTHGNIKSSNVLLTRDYDACVSDFGLVPLFSPSAVASRIVGYRAPEVAETRKVTHKSDVYSFGVLLLELLTGKAPTQTSNEEGIDLPRWVQSVVREEWTAEVFDVELMRYQNIEEEMVQMLQIAMACVAAVPDQRPRMTQVVKMIEDVRAFETDEGNRQSSSDKSKESNGQTPPQMVTPPESQTPAARLTP